MHEDAIFADLEAIEADIWTRWIRGAADRRSPFHTPAVGTVDRDGAPDARVMVLRQVDRIAGSFRFHTDRRAAKVDQLARSGRVAIIGYDTRAKIQLRASGIAAIATQGAPVDEAWAATSLSARRCYLADPAPGSVASGPTSGLPKAFETALPDIAASEAGRPNFAILIATIDRFEWLQLAATGHRRAAFTRDGDAWHGMWLVP